MTNRHGGKAGKPREEEEEEEEEEGKKKKKAAGASDWKGPWMHSCMSLINMCVSRATPKRSRIVPE